MMNCSPGVSRSAIALAALFLALVGGEAQADVAGGIAAFNRHDYPAAVSQFRIAADQDDPFAQNVLGTMYVQGLGVKRNYQLALDWFSKAQVLGSPEAMANLAKMYADGLGVAKSDATALRYYRDAALSGFRPALLLMVGIYENGGLGVAPDAKRALDWRARLGGKKSVPDQARSEPAAVPAPVKHARQADTGERSTKSPPLPKTSNHGKPAPTPAVNEALFEQRVFQQLENYQRRERKLFVGSQDDTPSLGAYLKELRTRLKRLPAAAFKTSRPGKTMVVTLSILSDGTLKNVELSQGSGNAKADRKVLSLLKSLARFRPLPAAIEAGTDVLVVAVSLPIE